jgi:hypothetical protein
MADKQEPSDEAVPASEMPIRDDVPYSIYTRREKWLIVGMVALAGFYRYVSFTWTC